MEILAEAESRALERPGPSQSPLAGGWPSILDAPPGACQAREGRCGASEWPLGSLPQGPEELEAWIERRRGWPYVEVRCANGHHRYVRLPIAPRPDRLEPEGRSTSWKHSDEPCRVCGLALGQVQSIARKSHAECIIARRRQRERARERALAMGKRPSGGAGAAPWTAERIAKAREAWLAGATRAELSVVMAVSLSHAYVVVSRLRRAGHDFPERRRGRRA